MDAHGNCTCIDCMPELHKCANCEECGAPIYPDYRLCDDCELSCTGTIDGIPVNLPEDIPAREETGD